jgi:hypothetical protein
MSHTLEYFAAKAKPLLDAIDGKRDEGLKRDRELRELYDEIDGLKVKLGALNTEAAEAGHLIADVHAAAAAIPAADGAVLAPGDTVVAPKPVTNVADEKPKRAKASPAKGKAK